MRIMFKKGMQRQILRDAIRKAGSEKKLGKVTNIPPSSIDHYSNERRNISEHRLNIILVYLDKGQENVEKFILKRLPENWGAKKGGHTLVKTSIEKYGFDNYMTYLKKRGAKIFKDWHKNTRLKSPENYSKIQYNRFKNAKYYKYSTDKGHYVRNLLEKRVADRLFHLGYDYQYEPFVKANGSNYFPDFKIGNLIIECTMWSGDDKVPKLKQKIIDFEEDGYSVVVVVTPNVEKVYKDIQEYVFTDINKCLGGSEFTPDRSK